MAALADALDAESVSLPAVGGLAAADAATILLLVVAGEIRHGVDVIGDPGRVLTTAAPFLLGWFVVAALVGAYGDRAFAGGARTLAVTAGAWLGGAGVGLTLRGTTLLPGNSPLSFAVVITALGTVSLAVVRLVAVPLLDARV